MKKILLLAMLVTMSCASIGKIAVVKGTAFVDRDMKAIKANNNMGILKKDTLVTENGRMQIIFKDNTVLSLGKKSKLIIEEYFYDKTNPQRVAATFKVENGFVKAITGAIGKMMPQMFTMETSIAKVTPHGTIWSVTVNKNSEHYVVSEGKIDISFMDGSGKNIELKSGETMTLNIGSMQGKKSVQSFVKKAALAVSQNEGKIEQSLATVEEDSSINRGTVVEKDGSVTIDTHVHGNNGHGTNPGGFNPGNPGQSSGNNDHGNNGHGTNPGGFNPSNPGQSGGNNGHGNNGHGTNPGGFNPGNPGQSSGNNDHGNNGHGTNPGGLHPNNPGQSSGNNDHGNNGHGTNPGGFNPGNPGQSGGNNGHGNSGHGNNTGSHKFWPW